MILIPNYLILLIYMEPEVRIISNSVCTIRIGNQYTENINIVVIDLNSIDIFLEHD